MSTRKNDNSSDMTSGSGEEVKIIRANNHLKQKVGVDVDLQTILSAENIAAVQQVVTRYEKDFLIWVEKDITALMQALRYTEQNISKSIPYVTKMKKAAFSIKSQAGTFGFELASEVARSLELFCEKDFKYEENQVIVLRKHIEALRTIITQNITSSGGQMGRDLMTALQLLIQKSR